MGAREKAVACARNAPLHSHIISYLDTFPTQLSGLPSLIISGPAGSGKYTVALVIVSGFSPSGMRYEKKLSISSGGCASQDAPSLPMSDIHFEVDMALPCFGTRASWISVHNAIVSAVEIRKKKEAIVLCKNFNQAEHDLRRIFASFMTAHTGPVHLRYLILTEHLSMLSPDIRRLCGRVPIGKPGITRSRELRGEQMNMPNVEHESAKGAIRAVVHNKNPATLFNLREALYAGLIRNMNVSEWAWYIFREWSCAHDKAPSPDEELIALGELMAFHKHHLSSYRPVFHLERLVLFLGAIHRCSVQKQ